MEAQKAPQDAPLVLTTQQDGIAKLTLNQPRKRNMLSSEMLQAVHAALRGFADDPAVRVIVIAAEGPVFSSGHNLKEFIGASQGEAKKVVDLCTETMLSVQRIPKPVIAQVAGLATAAGCQLVASCDLVVASTEAQFQTPGVQIGLFCSTPMIPLSRAVPPKQAMEMLLTGDPISAEQAHAAGLVNRVVPPAELEEATQALARHIAGYSAATIAIGKTAFYQQLPLGLEAAYDIGKEAITCNVDTEDGQEGMRAFVEKRLPKWKG